MTPVKIKKGYICKQCNDNMVWPDDKTNLDELVCKVSDGGCGTKGCWELFESKGKEDE